MRARTNRSNLVARSFWHRVVFSSSLSGAWGLRKNSSCVRKQVLKNSTEYEAMSNVGGMSLHGVLILRGFKMQHPNSCTDPRPYVGRQSRQMRLGVGITNFPIPEPRTLNSFTRSPKPCFLNPFKPIILNSQPSIQNLNSGGPVHRCLLGRIRGALHRRLCGILAESPSPFNW